MIVRARNDVVVLLEVLVEDHLARFGALDPQILRRLAAREEILDLRRDDVGYPVHRAIQFISASNEIRRAPRGAAVEPYLVVRG